MIKRMLIVVGLVVVALVLAAGGAVIWALAGRRPVVDGAEFNGARIVADGPVTASVLPVGEGKVALIDAGNDPEGRALLTELSRRGLGADAVVAILLTHGHDDHTGAVRRFPQAAVMALEREVPIVEGREASKGPMLRLVAVSPTGIEVSRVLHDGETVMVGDAAVRVFAVPGHTAGSAAYLVRGNLFIGDSADATTEGTLQGAPWIFSDSQEANRAALVRLDERLRRSEAVVTTIIPSHSGALTDGLTQLDAFARAGADHGG